MATIREGNQEVLVVVDMQAGVMNETWNSPRIIRNVTHVVERARTQGIPVLWVQHADDELIFGSPAWQLAQGLTPAENEVQINKHFNSAFEQTTLEEHLARLGAAHIVLAGAATNWCIRATAYAALDRGYDLTLVEDAHTTGPLERDDGTRIEAADIIQDLNTTMKWVSYPGRRNSVVASESLNFGG